MLKLMRSALVLLLLMTLLTGFVYPLAVTVLAQALFPRQANGSLVYYDGEPLGSALIGQNFTHYLRVFIGQLRRKIEADPSRPRHIITEPGVGYRLM